MLLDQIIAKAIPLNTEGCECENQPKIALRAEIKKLLIQWFNEQTTEKAARQNDGQVQQAARE